LLKAEKQKHEVSLQQIKTLKAKLFPSNGLQERSENGLPLLAKYGMGWLDKVKEALQPLDSTFKILEEG
jgi:bacillithiol synthase